MTPIILYALAIAITLFIVGVGIGWILTQDSQQTTKEKLKTGIAIAVTIVWMFVVVADVLVTGYTLSPLVHAIMGAVVGYFFTEDGLSINVGGD